MKKNKTCLQVESLEDRQLMSANPVVYSVIKEGAHDWQSQRAHMAPMMETQLRGRLQSTRDTDMILVHMKAGQILSADLDGHGSWRRRDAKLTVKDWRGRWKTLESNDNGIDPVTGRWTRDPSLVFRAPRTRTYYIEVANSNAIRPQNYNLRLQKFDLNHNVGREWLNRSEGSLYAFKKGDELIIAGPVGHGFAMRGNWQQTVHGSGVNQYSTYSVTSTATNLPEIVYLQMGRREIPMPVAPGTTFSITTSSHKWGDYFGEITDMDWNANLQVDKVARPFKSDFGLNYRDVKGPQSSWGIALGRDLEDTEAPLNAAVPYLYYDVDAGFEYETSFGKTSASWSAGHALDVIFDPSDPFLYMGVDDFAFAGSFDGNIAYSPDAQPMDWHGNLFGHLYFKGGMGDVIPRIGADGSGDVIIDLDANKDGNWLGREWRTPGDLLKRGRFSHNAILDAKVGANGGIDVGFGGGGFNIGIPLTEASLIFDATQQGIFVHGNAVDPLEGTVLETITPKSTMWLDGSLSYRGGKLSSSLTLYGDFSIAGHRLASGMIHFGMNEKREVLGRNYNFSGVLVTGTFDAFGVGGTTLTGTVRANGDFSLTGTNYINTGVSIGKATFRISRFTNPLNHRSRTLVTAKVHAKIGIDGFSGEMNAHMYVDGRGNWRMIGNVKWTAFWVVKSTTGVGLSNEGISFQDPTGKWHTLRF